MLTGDKPWQESVSLGSWERLESYAHDIIEVINVVVLAFNHLFHFSFDEFLGFKPLGNRMDRLEFSAR